jgi:hypothetical protein
MSLRSRWSWLAGALIICAVLVVVLLLRPSERCGAERRLDLLFGGGRPVCLGGSFAPLLREAGRGQLLLDNSGGGYYTLSEKGRTYTYVATGGHAPWGGAARWARVRSACVKGLRGPDESAQLASAIRDRAGASWEQETIAARSGRSAWRTSNGLRLYASSSGEVCLLHLR